MPILEVSFCCLCGRPTADWRICKRCIERTALKHLWPALAYEEVGERLVRALKFERAREAATALAGRIDTQLPYLQGWVVVPLPTAPARVRQRGYDQAVLLARALARQRGLPYSPLLGRMRDNRQIGASRRVRQCQADSLFYIKWGKTVVNRDVLLIDDVCTTGSTMKAAAALIKKAGAANVAGAVAAWKNKSWYP